MIPTVFLREHRYQRHFALPQVGGIGQERLGAASIACVGAGGLGSVALLYLAAAGVGNIRIIDDDHVALSNLQRQIIHTTASIGELKTDSAKHTLAALNPDVAVETYAQKLTAQSAATLLSGSDVIIDATDNFDARYAINDFGSSQHVPVVHGSIYQFEGQVTTFNVGQGPCYRCFQPLQPPADATPNCADAGVLGVLPGVIGSLQATEALKLILDIGTSLSGRLLSYNALDAAFMEFGIQKDDDCLTCRANVR